MILDIEGSPVQRAVSPQLGRMMSIASAAGTLGKPGMVMIYPQIATTNSAPAESRTSRTLTM